MDLLQILNAHFDFWFRIFETYFRNGIKNGKNKRNFAGEVEDWDLTLKLYKHNSSILCAATIGTVGFQNKFWFKEAEGEQ